MKIIKYFTILLAVIMSLTGCGRVYKGYNKRVEEASSKLRVGMSTSQAKEIFKGTWIHDEILEPFKRKDAQETKAIAFDRLGYEDMHGFGPDDRILDKIKFNGTIGAIWVPYNIKLESALGYSAEVIIVFYEIRRDKVIGWFRVKPPVLGNRFFSLNLFKR